MCKWSPKDIDISGLCIIIKSWHALKFENMSNEIIYQLDTILKKNKKKCLVFHTSITGSVGTFSTSIQHVPKNFSGYFHISCFCSHFIPGIKLLLILFCSYLWTFFQNIHIQNILSKWEMKWSINLRKLRKIQLTLISSVLVA